MMMLRSANSLETASSTKAETNIARAHQAFFIASSFIRRRHRRGAAP
jgi:hypothetical protein